MATLTYFIRTTKKPTEKVSIRVRLRHNENYFYAKTSYKVAPQNWDKKKQRIKQGKEHSTRDTINNKLTSLETYIMDQWNLRIDKSLLDSEWLQDSINLFFKKTVKEEKEISLQRFINKYFDNIELYVSDKTGKKLNPSTIRKLKASKQVLKDFIEKRFESILLTDVNYAFYESFVQYLTDEKKYAVNTVGKHIGSLKAILSFAKRKGYNIDTERFKRLSEESDNIYLNEDELQKIYDLDLSENKRLEKVRDLFIVGAWTGLRFGDLTTINKDSIQNDMIIIEQSKTSEKVYVPLHWMTKAILEKYDYDLPVQITNQKFNEYIKEVCDEAKINEIFIKGITVAGKRKIEKFKKFKKVSSHTARRSFATNLYNSDFPVISIMAITGHKSERAFLSYIKVTPEEHAKKLQRHWEKFVK